MALFQKSLTFVAALGLPLALVACGGGDTGKDTSGTTDSDADADGDTDTDADSDTDADADLETGFGYEYWIGSIDAPGGTFSSGYFGVGIFGNVDGDWACRNYGEMTEAAPEGQPCEVCDYQYEFTVAASSWDGPYCAGLGMDADFGWSDSGVHGMGWGLAEYEWPQSDGSTYLVGDPIFLHYFSTDYPDGDWFPFLFDYVAGGYEFSEQDSDGFNSVRPYIARDDAGNAYWAYAFYYRY